MKEHAIGIKIGGFNIKGETFRKYYVHDVYIYGTHQSYHYKWCDGNKKHERPQKHVASSYDEMIRCVMADIWSTSVKTQRFMLGKDW